MKNLAALLAVALGLFGSLASCRSTGEPPSTCTVEGCVERPGPIEMTDDMTVFEAVMSAGPIEGRSDLRHVQLVRPSPDDELTMHINLEEMIQAGNSTFNVLLQPGDVLTVPEKKH